MLRPDDGVICIGVEMFLIDWNDMWHRGITREKTFKWLLDTLRHETDHKAIYDLTNSRKACLTFDLLFTGMSKYWKTNREYFLPESLSE